MPKNEIFATIMKNIAQVVYWKSVLKLRNSDLMSLFVEADVIISVCNFDQSAARSPLTPNAPVT